VNHLSFGAKRSEYKNEKLEMKKERTRLQNTEKKVRSVCTTREGFFTRRYYAYNVSRRLKKEISQKRKEHSDKGENSKTVQRYTDEEKNKQIQKI
jgi:uncharacterized Zn finger protein